jgi:MFS family permease
MRYSAFRWAGRQIATPSTRYFFGVLIWALATVACGFSTSFGNMLCRIFVGIGGLRYYRSYALIADAFSKDWYTMATSVFRQRANLDLRLPLASAGWPLRCQIAEGIIPLHARRAIGRSLSR